MESWIGTGGSYVSNDRNSQRCDFGSEFFISFSLSPYRAYGMNIEKDSFVIDETICAGFFWVYAILLYACLILFADEFCV